LNNEIMIKIAHKIIIGRGSRSLPYNFSVQGQLRLAISRI
jgi:hypothetical protein